MAKSHTPTLRFQGFSGDWEEKLFGELVTLRNEVVEQQAYCVDIELENLVSEMGQVIGDTSVRTQSNTLFKNGDILFGKLRPYLKKWWLANCNGVKSGEIWSFVCDENYSAEFIYRTIQTKNFLDKTNVTSGTKMPRAEWKTVSQIDVRLPEKPEQTQIGNFFRQLDEQIAQARAVWEKSIQLKKAMLGKMFPVSGSTKPEIRFKGFSGDWECRKLGEVAEFAKGKGLSKSSVVNNGLTQCVLYGELYTKYGCCIDKIVSSTNEKMENPTLSRSNDVLLPTSDVTPNGLAKGCAIFQDNVVLGGDILVVRSSKIFGLFLAYYIESKPVMIIEKATGTTVFHIYEKDLRDVMLLLPNQEEQTQIGNFFRQLDNTIALQSAELEKLTQLKKGLLSAMLV